MVRPRRISDFKPTLSNLAQSSHYQVIFSGLPTPLRQHLNVRGVGYRFITETSGLLCYSAVLPGSRLATADIVGNFMGVSEKMAHTRLFTQIQLEFYVDNEYKTLKFLDHWIEFIGNGSGQKQSNAGYYYRMEYPDSYKSNQTKIIKFDRDYKEEIEYTFYGMFPIDLSSTTVKYENSEVLKATATFSFDRYIAGKFDSYSISRGTDNNKDSGSIWEKNRESIDSETNVIPFNENAWNGESMEYRGSIPGYDPNNPEFNTGVGRKKLGF